MLWAECYQHIYPEGSVETPSEQAYELVIAV